MPYLDALADHSDLVWTQLLGAMDLALMDAPHDTERENVAVQVIRDLYDRYGYQTLKQTLDNHLKQTDLDFLYWFARAGMREVIVDVEPYLDSLKIDELVLASVSLTLLADPRGIEVIERLCRGEHRVRLDDPRFYLETTLSGSRVKPLRASQR